MLSPFFNKVPENNGLYRKDTSNILGQKTRHLPGTVPFQSTRWPCKEKPTHVAALEPLTLHFTPRRTSWLPSHPQTSIEAQNPLTG